MASRHQSLPVADHGGWSPPIFAIEALGKTASIQSKVNSGKTYYYLMESGRVGGAPRIVSQRPHNPATISRPTIRVAPPAPRPSHTVTTRRQPSQHREQALHHGIGAEDGSLHRCAPKSASSGSRAVAGAWTVSTTVSAD